MQPSNTLKNFSVKFLVSFGCFSLLLKAQSLKDCYILASTHTQNKTKKKVLLFIYLFILCVSVELWIIHEFFFFYMKQNNTKTLVIGINPKVDPINGVSHKR